MEQIKMARDIQFCSLGIRSHQIRGHVALWQEFWPRPARPAVGGGARGKGGDRCRVRSPWGSRETPHLHSGAGAALQQRGGRAQPQCRQTEPDPVWTGLSQPTTGLLGDGPCPVS